MKKLLSTSLIVLLIDQLLKIVFTSKNIVIIKNFFNIEYATNKGAAWSILNGNTFFLIVLTIGILVVMGLYFKNKKLTNSESYIYGLMLGGILGNLIDRIIFGYVKDFVSFNFGGYQFPIFNIADIAITIGAFLLILTIIKENRYD